MPLDLGDGKGAGAGYADALHSEDKKRYPSNSLKHLPSERQKIGLGFYLSCLQAGLSRVGTLPTWGPVSLAHVWCDARERVSLGKADVCAAACRRWLILNQDKHLLLHFGDDLLPLSELVDGYVGLFCVNGASGALLLCNLIFLRNGLPGSSCLVELLCFLRLE